MALFRPPPSRNVVHHGAPLFEMRAPATKIPIIQSSHAVLEWYRMLNIICAPAQSQKQLSHQGRAIDHEKHVDARASSTTPDPIPTTPLFTIIKQPIARPTIHNAHLHTTINQCIIPKKRMFISTWCLIYNLVTIPPINTMQKSSGGCQTIYTRIGALE